jgi:hypothetical protein
MSKKGNDGNDAKEPLFEPSFVRYRIHSVLDCDTGEVIPYDPYLFRASDIKEFREFEKKLTNQWLKKMGELRRELKPYHETEMEKGMRERQLMRGFFSKAKKEGEEGEG